jgi:hypothetical protein
MRAALQDLHAALLSLPPEQAIARIVEFLESGADQPIGLAFQVGPGGALRGASSLRAILLDWLHQLDPRLAADRARHELRELGTRLPPDVYVIHLRNYELGSPEPAPARHALLDTYFGAMLAHAPWMESPSTALAEAMDIAVHIEAVHRTPELAALLERDQPQLLRHASALALERLVDRRPLDSLGAWLDAALRTTSTPAARAGYFARLDPALPGAADLLRAYLTSPALSPVEVEAFLGAFPNLNQSLSHNLLSSHFPATTASGDHVARLRAARQQLESWRADPAMGRLHDRLAAAARQLARLAGDSP